jgi:hypothetical protein
VEGNSVLTSVSTIGSQKWLLGCDMWCDGSCPNQEYKMTGDGDMGLWLVWVMFRTMFDVPCSISFFQKVMWYCAFAV